jgi:hypothetical protein
MCVLSAGSPRSVTSQITFRLLNVQIVPRMIAGARIGFSIGSVMWKNFLIADAPSMSAAS